MRVLLSEGSGLTSRQVATCLGELGHEVEVLSSSALCLARFTRRVRRVHRVPPFGTHPLAWFEAARRIARVRGIDVLFPTQEQVTILSALEGALGVPTIVPRFETLRRVQDKVSAFETLREVGVRQPPTIVARTPRDLSAVDRFPLFVKRPVSTASTGVRRAGSREELVVAARTFGLEHGGVVLVQSSVEGPLAMVQIVADRGRLVACHANVRVREGASGSACTKESLVSAEITALSDRLVRALGWHGALSLDVILTRDGAQVIDVNPRLVEPRNAWLADVDLVSPMLALACGERPPTHPGGCPGVRTHQLLLALLGIAHGSHARRALVRELVAAATHAGPYATGVEELTPLARDPLAAVPVVAAALSMLVDPSASRWFEGGAIGNYALTSQGWEEILRAVAPRRSQPEEQAERASPPRGGEPSCGALTLGIEHGLVHLPAEGPRATLDVDGQE